MASPSNQAEVKTAAPSVGSVVAQEFDLAIFDLDGVITRTAAVHAIAWKRMFDEFLQGRAARRHELFQEFTPQDYLAYIDGRLRYDGVKAFLESRGISMPFGATDDRSSTETVCGLGNQKNEQFSLIIARDGIGVYESSVELIRHLQELGIQIALATSSRNSGVILSETRLAPLFATVVNGIDLERLQLKGKPAPDIFTTAARNLGVPFARAIVIEDAVSGVQAGSRGGFALVIGIARENNARELRENGADLVVRDLAETNVEEIKRLIRAKRGGA